MVKAITFPTGIQNWQDYYKVKKKLFFFWNFPKNLFSKLNQLLFYFTVFQIHLVEMREQ